MVSSASLGCYLFRALILELLVFSLGRNQLSWGIHNDVVLRLCPWSSSLIKGRVAGPTHNVLWLQSQFCILAMLKSEVLCSWFLPFSSLVILWRIFLFFWYGFYLGLICGEVDSLITAYAHTMQFLVVIQVAFSLSSFWENPSKPHPSRDFWSASWFLVCLGSYLRRELLTPRANCLQNLRIFCNVLTAGHCRSQARHCRTRSFHPFLLKLHGLPLLHHILLPAKFESILENFCSPALPLGVFLGFDLELLLDLWGLLWSFLWKFGFKPSLLCLIELILFSRTWFEQSIDLWLICSFAECFFVPGDGLG
jgi:hypothetical protein